MRKAEHLICLHAFHHASIALHLAAMLSHVPKTCTLLFPQDHSQEEKEPDVAWDVEDIASNENGLVIFDGGAYSRGPTAIFDDSGDSSPGQDEALEADKDRLERQLSLEASSQLRMCTPAPCCL